MAYGYLGDATPTASHLMSDLEIAGFLARHPVVATEVGTTQWFMQNGMYDFSYYDKVYQPWEWEVKFPGVIEPIGMQVQDDVYGLVTIEPVPSRQILFTAFSDHALHTEVPTTGSGSYVPPPHTRTWLDDLIDAALLGGVAIGAIYLLSDHRTGNVAP